MGVLGLAVKAAKKAAAPGIRAYHGSPHKFDKFSLDKVGTGEGAQAYGHGIYLAENERVAEDYRNKLSGGGPWWDMRQANHGLGTARGRLEKLTDPGYKRYALYDKGVITKISQNPFEGGVEIGALPAEVAAAKRAQAAALRALVAAQKSYAAAGSPPPPGHMYEANIRADPSQMLDWDAPMSAQGSAPKDFLHEELKRYLGSQYDRQIPNFANKDGGELLEATQGRNLGPRFSARALSAGIPGVKYLDQGSRGNGGGSRNFAVFDDNLIDVLRRYAKGGAVSSLVVKKKVKG